MRALWNKGLMGKVAIIGGALIGFLVLCCVLGALVGQRTSQQTADVFATIEAGLGTPVAGATRAPERTESATVELRNMPEPTRAPAATAEPSTPSQTEPSRGLGMSRAAWEAKAGAPTGKGIIGEKYANGVEAEFLDDVLWRIDYAFQEGSYPTPDDAHDIGKMFIPDDATLVRTYQRDVTTVNLYHSDWLASRFDADMFTGGEPGDFTLQYNVFEGEVHSLIIGLGDNP